MYVFEKGVFSSTKSLPVAVTVCDGVSVLSRTQSPLSSLRRCFLCGWMELLLSATDRRRRAYELLRTEVTFFKFKFEKNKKLK